ncbi:MAG: polysaccharide pyruvyl transferase family protein [Lachnospiraceae bacterium]|jgi:hypothetical protein|nr:polysaccharide pyruvyl transferase family protein [Lachnospiraceae bacterium]
MRKIGTISYNIYCNFTNYGSALQTWALHQAIKRIGYTPVLVDYCPEVLADKDPFNPYKGMWDQDEESKRMCELTMPAICENFIKFDRFYHDRFDRTVKKYTSGNFCEIGTENLDGFVCGSDTIFCIDEFKGFDDGYYANYPEMKGKAVSYAASFGDSHFDDQSYLILNERLQNFKAIGLRENQMIPYVKEHVDIPVARTIDPTLLLTSKDYDLIAARKQCDEPYLLLYSRRYDPGMEVYAERMAKEKGLQIVEISLRATNAYKGHIMRYDAGVEEFLSLVKYSSFVITNSFHGLIFAVQYRRPMVVFTREQADSKISESLELMDLKRSKFTTGKEENRDIDYDAVHANIDEARIRSLTFLKMELELI